jgi:hypothetical protein
MTCEEFDALRTTTRRLTLAEIAAVSAHGRECPRCMEIMTDRINEIKENSSAEEFAKIIMKGMNTVKRILEDEELADSAPPGYTQIGIRPMEEITEAMRILDFFVDPDTRPACNCQAEGRGRQCRRNTENLEIMLDTLLWVMGIDRAPLGQILHECKKFMQKEE